MKVLVTGDRGYIGSVLVEELAKKNYTVVGYDYDYYRGCDIFPQVRDYHMITKDIRDVRSEDLLGIEGIVHLAALSNDPLGELSPGLTESINYEGTMKLAKLAKENGVKRFVYASSQSMYGVSTLSNELEEDNSQKNPLTAYAKTKWEAECALKNLHDRNFTVVCFRPSTVFGLSSRLRCDIIFNNLLACAYTTGKIEIKSDGTPWRPIIHAKDVSSAFIAGLVAPVEIVGNESFNVGIKNGNFTVREIAEVVQKLVKDCQLVFTGEHGNDSRTYKVSFDKILNKLGDYYKPEWGLERAGMEMIKKFDEINFSEKEFRGTTCNRLMQINYLLKNNLVNKNLQRI